LPCDAIIVLFCSQSAKRKIAHKNISHLVTRSQFFENSAREDSLTSHVINPQAKFAQIQITKEK